jgi:uncharacterized protein
VGKRKAGVRRVVLDTNVLVSAVGWSKGKPHRIMEKVVRGEIELFISYGQFEELSRVLDYPKLKFTEIQKLGFKRLLTEKVTFVDPEITLDIVKDDPSDNIILESALVAKADFIITGDEHLRAVGELQGVRIVTASQFLSAEA